MLAEPELTTLIQLDAASLAFQAGLLEETVALALTVPCAAAVSMKCGSAAPGVSTEPLASTPVSKRVATGWTKPLVIVPQYNHPSPEAQAASE